MATTKQSQALPRTFVPSEARDAYRRVAWFYDGWAKLTESRAARRTIELAQLDPQEKVLEVAVGTGLLLQRLRPHKSAGLQVGIDLSPAMLARAGHRMKAQRGGHTYLMAANAAQLPFADHRFDVIVNCFMLDLLPESSFGPILAEFRRVLKPHGRLVLTTMAFGHAWYHGFWRLLAKHFPAMLTGCRPVALVPVLEQNNFKNIRSEFISQNTFPAEVIRAEI